MDRRTSLKWMLAVSAAGPLAFVRAGSTAAVSAAAQYGKPYGTDPKLIDPYHPGELWPLTFTPAQRLLAAALCDVILPADGKSPSASSVGVVDFIDEWISAPYELQRDDRSTVLAGFGWLDAEAQRRFSHPTHALQTKQLRHICDDICYLPRATSGFARAATFFAKYRDLTMGGFYTTPEGRKDLDYLGNVPLATFDGPSVEVLKKVGLA